MRKIGYLMKKNKNINEELYPSSVGMVGYNSGVSGYPLDNVLTSRGDVDPTLHDVLKNQEIPQVNYPKKRRRKVRPNDAVAKAIDTLSKPTLKVVKEKAIYKPDLKYVIEVEDRRECQRIIDGLKRMPHKDWWCNENIETLTNFPNWLNVELRYEDARIHINYWSDEGTYDYNLERVLQWTRRDGINKIYTYRDLPWILREVNRYFDTVEPPSYRPKRIIRTLEGAETTPTVGSGTMVGFGETPMSYVKSAGQSVYGGDSPSSFGNNSTDNEVKLEIVVPPKHRFHEAKRRKQKKSKQNTPYYNLGEQIDKKTNENMIKNFAEFTKLYEDGEGGGVASATLGSTGGMGAVTSAQPSSIPGDVAGSTIGSGDIGRVLGTYTKEPAPPRRKKEKRKKEKLYHKLGAGIDNFYRTKYVQSTSNGNTIQKWNTFTK